MKPGQFQEFGVSLGPIPSDAKQLVFKTLQTYSDGTVVRWIDEPKERAEAEHPAPVLDVVAAAALAAAQAAVATPESPTRTTTLWVGSRWARRCSRCSWLGSR